MTTRAEPGSIGGMHTDAKKWLACAALAALACGGDNAPTTRPLDVNLATRFIASYAALLAAQYEDNVRLARTLKERIDAFVASAAQGGDASLSARFEAAKTAWKDARPYYIQTEHARFYGGPIDNADDGPEAFINAWPLDEAYVDYVVGAPTAGLIQDATAYPVIDEATLRTANELGGETNIATGWHAIEFLLWGQDTVLGPGGGARPYTDYLDEDKGGTAPRPDRRRTYLTTLAAMLVADLERVAAQWAAAPAGTPGDNYRARFVALPPREALTRVLTGIGTLVFGELRGERLVVPYNSKDKEDEHSCFSDTTHLDHVNDVVGVMNVWRGRYDGRALTHRGVALEELATQVDPARSRDITATLEAVRRDLSSIGPTFEEAIVGDDTSPGRRALLSAITRLSTLNGHLAELARAFGVTISTSL